MARLCPQAQLKTRRCKIVALVLIAAVIGGCASASPRRVLRYERQIAQLEEQLERAKRAGLAPSTIKVPPELRREIEKLRVYRPYGATALAVFPGLLVPGLGSLAVGDSKYGFEHLGQAYTGVGECVLGIVAVMNALVLESMCGTGSDALGELALSGFEMFGFGVARYFGSWLDDIESTYAANDYLASRVRHLKRRYNRFVVSYLKYCREYQLRKKENPPAKRD